MTNSDPHKKMRLILVCFTDSRDNIKTRINGTRAEVAAYYSQPFDRGVFPEERLERPYRVEFIELDDDGRELVTHAVYVSPRRPLCTYLIRSRNTAGQRFHAIYTGGSPGCAAEELTRTLADACRVDPSHLISAELMPDRDTANRAAAIWQRFPTDRNWGAPDWTADDLTSYRQLVNSGDAPLYRATLCHDVDAKSASDNWSDHEAASPGVLRKSLRSQLARLRSQGKRPRVTSSQALNDWNA